MKNLFILVLVMISGIAFSQELTKHGYEYLKSKYLGSHNGLELLKEYDISSEVKYLLKDEEKHFYFNLGFLSDVETTEGSIIIHGFAPHQGGSEEAAICISGNKPTVEIAILSKEHINLYSREQNYGYLSACIKDWVVLVTHRERGNKPKNVTQEIIR